MTKTRSQLRRCANGCDEPPKPPSLVICKRCQEKVTEGLKRMLEKMADNAD